jgi:hypothetical protein
MNRMHIFAKIMLSGIGIFFAIRLLASMPTLMWMAVTRPSDLSLPVALFWTAFLGLCLAALLYVFLYRGEELAKRIAAARELAEPDTKLHWLPAAFRLVCMAAGLYCLSIAIWNTTHILLRYLLYYQMYQNIRGITVSTPEVLSIEQVISCVLMLILGIYLVLGAPHFVRWHINKTLQICKQQPETKEVNS